ncbi:uncharacterized protein [Dermacentor andersoni]|uniref:uncharacterized protein isoform X7 n=1 Tax=Dermacentor andersoni TaxID=34620 RepID=UPI002415C616|nr:uncharacterized protein LOC126539350 isoform X7 [Dermacentor andersoni]
MYVYIHRWQTCTLKMAAPITAKIIDFDGDQSEAQANLQFQDFSDTLQGSSDQRSQQAVNQAYTSFSDMNDDEDESDEGLWKRDCPHRHWDGYHHILLQLLNRERDASAPSFWKFSYYQSLFDVTTNDVLRRLLWSAMPQFSSPSYLEKHIRPNPDLYGPIWVGLTLVVTTSVSSNVASYLETAGQSKDFWHTDYTRDPVGCAPDLAAVDIGCRGCFALWLCPGHHFVAFLQGRLPQDGHHHVCCCICITCITGSWLCGHWNLWHTIGTSLNRVQLARLSWAMLLLCF